MSEEVPEIDELSLELSKAPTIIKAHVSELHSEITRLHKQIAKLKVQFHSKEQELKAQLEEERANKLQINISEQDSKL